MFPRNTLCMLAQIVHIISKNLYADGMVLRKKVEKHRKKLPSTCMCDDIELLPFDVLTDHLILWWDKSGVIPKNPNTKQ